MTGFLIAFLIIMLIIVALWVWLKTTNTRWANVFNGITGRFRRGERRAERNLQDAAIHVARPCTVSQREFTDLWLKGAHDYKLAPEELSIRLSEWNAKLLEHMGNCQRVAPADCSDSSSSDDSHDMKWMLDRFHEYDRKVFESHRSRRSVKRHMREWKRHANRMSRRIARNQVESYELADNFDKYIEHRANQLSNLSGRNIVGEAQTFANRTAESGRLLAGNIWKALSGN